MKTLEIDVISDVVCPWCLIGATRLEQALAQRPELDARVTYHPFVLDPSTPKGGADLREHLRQKYGMDAEQMFGRVEAAARESGIPLDFAKVRRSVQTTGAHVLLQHALEKGTQRALARALFEAYFLEGLDVGEDDVLVGIAERHGFTADEARALLASDAERTAVQAEAMEASRQGVRGVPFFIFDKRLGLSGAQPVSVFLQALDKLTSDAED